MNKTGRNGCANDNPVRFIFVSSNPMKLPSLIFFTALAPILLSAQENRVRPLTSVPIRQVVVEDEFWSPKLKVWQEVTIRDCFSKFDASAPH
jgi:hypothetical protein